MKNNSKQITVVHATQLRNEFGHEGALIGLLLIGSQWLLVASESSSDLAAGDAFAAVEVSNACTGVDRLRAAVSLLDSGSRAGILVHFSDLNDVADQQLSRCLTA